MFSTDHLVAARRYGFDRHEWDVPIPLGVHGRKVDLTLFGVPLAVEPQMPYRSVWVHRITLSVTVL
jgi:hypothetical protein